MQQICHCMSRFRLPQHDSRFKFQQCRRMSWGRAIWTAAGSSCSECPSQVAKLDTRIENSEGCGRMWSISNSKFGIRGSSEYTSEYIWIPYSEVVLCVGLLWTVGFRYFQISSACLIQQDLPPHWHLFCTCLTCVVLGLLRCRTCARPILCADDPEATLLKAHSCRNCIAGLHIVSHSFTMASKDTCSWDQKMLHQAIQLLWGARRRLSQL